MSSVRVAVRVRPFNSRELSRDCSCVIDMLLEHNTTGLMHWIVCKLLVPGRHSEGEGGAGGVYRPPPNDCIMKFFCTTPKAENGQPTVKCRDY